MPPDIAIPNVMFGAFRGLAVDLMWLRLNNMQEEGRFQEMNDLAQWICQLHPRYPKVWLFHAWNMAYNVSVATTKAEERWKWVRDGIALLRDQGIPLNPDSVLLYRELSWIFLHKLGHHADEMHFYYRREFAREWHEVLGPPAKGRAINGLNAFLPIAEAYAAHVDPNRPLADEHDPVESFKLAASGDEDDAHTRAVVELQKLIDQEYAPDVELLRGIGRAMALRNSVEVQYIASNRFLTYPVDQRLVDWIADESIDVEVRDTLLAFLRAKVLYEHYHMDPSVMLSLIDGSAFPEVDDEQAYLDAWEPEDRPLPLDWRHPGSHALYWAALGEIVARRLLNVHDKQLDVLNTYRQVMHASQQLRDSGQLLFDPVDGHYPVMMADPRQIPAYERVFFAAGHRFSEEDTWERAPDAPMTFRAGHENFLIWAVQLAYYNGDRRMATLVYERLRREYHDFKADREARYAQTLDDFVIQELGRDPGMEGMDEIKRAVEGLFRQAIHLGYVRGKMEVVGPLFRRARHVHESYQSKRILTSPDPSQPPARSLPRLGVMFRDVLRRELEMPPEQLSPRLKARLWSRLLLPTQQEMYWFNGPELREEARGFGLDPDKAFPVPEGMEQYVIDRRKLSDETDEELNQHAPTTKSDPN
ncbi:MAG: hypothetical protein CMJ49_04705 [Planctomycetaceae bacterium]|nr:hypothetical protein [Planctomycetaceae bacterium]